MTITYSNDVATANGFVFLRLLWRWNGSVYKLLWKDLLIFLVLYYLIHIVYLFGLSEANQTLFEAVVDYTAGYGKQIPLSFVLGFFVSNVMTRWWNQYTCIPWPTSIAVYVSSTIHGYDEVGRAMRRTIMRYVCLSLTMVLRVLSPRVQKRFPKVADMVVAGLLHENELTIIEDLDRKFPNYSKNFLPIVWAATIVTRARKEGRIQDDFAVKTLIEALNKFRGECGMLMTYNTISIPLVYTQVVTIAVYTYFITALIAQQYVKKATALVAGGLNIDFFPFLIILQFVFYMGWLKVAETLMNPFGEDDDDFDVNSMIDKNLQSSYLIVDEMHNEHPELLKDQYWDEIPGSLPDMSNETNEGKESKKGIDRQSDVLDYEVVTRPNSVFRRRSTSTKVIIKNEDDKKKNSDVELGSDEPRTSTAAVNPDLIPRSSVISGKYKNDANIKKEQNIIEREMKESKAAKMSQPIDDSDISD